MSTPNTNPSDLDREALLKALEAYSPYLSGQPDQSRLSAAIRAYINALPSASGVPEAEVVAWQWRWRYTNPALGRWSEWKNGRRTAPIGAGFETEERALYASPPPVAAPSREAAEERIAELQYEAGVYQSLYENVINTAGYQKANTIGELAGWQWRPNGATVWRSDATVKWLDEQGDAIEKRPVFTAYPYDNGGDTLYDALESALWETPGWKDKVRAASALLTRTTFQTSSPIASELKDAGSRDQVVWVNSAVLQNLMANETPTFAGVKTILWRNEKDEGKRHQERTPLYASPSEKADQNGK